jgi:hypothetical protein
MARITKKSIVFLADTLGLDVFTYQPGDGQTRYKFAPKGVQECYWSGLGYIVLGAKEAEGFLRGYQYAGIWSREELRLTIA